MISSESRRLERLVADLLDLARLDAHQFSLHPTPVDAHAVVQDAVEAFGPAAADIGVALDGRAGYGRCPATLDAQRLAQIVANLVENALKFATTRVVVGVHAVGDRVELHVDDDGPGIAPADLPRVFERLYTSRTVPGRTLGTGHRPRDRARAGAGDGWRRPRRADRRRGHALRGDVPRRALTSDDRACARPPSQRSSTADGGSISRRT